MIKKPDNWETTEAMDGTFKQLTPGGHKCIIKQAKVGTSKTGNEMLILCFDIADGDELAGFYMDMYGRNVVKDGNNAKWPNNGIYRQVTSGKSEGIFKGLIVNIEKSNPGYTWNWDERSLIGKQFGGVFREEEYMGNDGSVKTSVKCVGVRPTEGIETIPVPTKKELQGGGGYSRGASSTFGPSIPDEEIPF